MRIFLDANILFSAAKTDGAVRRLLALLRARDHVLCVDAYVVAEARRNLEAKGPEALAAFDGLLDGLETGPLQTTPGTIPVAADALPEKDRPVLAAAVRMRCQVLVTGDRTHFGQFYGKSVAGVTIHSPASLVEEI